ncbi:MAG: VWA domain-containing protein [Candidatus Pacebacteria bacterium]|nr:VWA domain-containing protein [Candidatus Paceibacterota bacterium]
MVREFIISTYKKGFVLLYALVLVSVLLTLVFGISNINIREYQLLHYGDESLISFYAAESGLECALYWDIKEEKSAFRIDPVEDPTGVGREISCAGNIFTVGIDPETTLQINLPDSDGNAMVVIDKTGGGTDIVSRGYNTDDPNNKYAVERGLKVGYGDTATTDGLYDITLVIDNSNSICLVEDPDPYVTSCNNMQSLIDAAKSIIDNFHNSELGDDGTKFSVIGFETVAFIQQRLSGNKHNIKDALDEMKSTGGTNTSGGMLLAEYEYNDPEHDREDAKEAKNIIILMTDGDGNTCIDSAIYEIAGKGVVDGMPWCWEVPESEAACARSENETRPIVSRLKFDNDAYLIVIGIEGAGFEGAEAFNEDFMQEIADKYIFIEGFEGIDEVTSQFDADYFERFIEDVERREF